MVSYCSVSVRLYQCFKLVNSLYQYWIADSAYIVISNSGCKEEIL